MNPSPDRGSDFSVIKVEAHEKADLQILEDHMVLPINHLFQVHQLSGFLAVYP